VFVTSILGRKIVRALGQDLEQWTTIHALSRSQKENVRVHVGNDADSVMLLAEKLTIANVAAEIGRENNLRWNKKSILVNWSQQQRLTGTMD
jgi:hypothetical protein